MWIRFFQSTVTYPGRGSWSSTRHHRGAFAVMDGLMDRIVYRSNGFRCFGVYIYIKVWIHPWYGMCMYSWLYQVGVSLCYPRTFRLTGPLSYCANASQKCVLTAPNAAISTLVAEQGPYLVPWLWGVVKRKHPGKRIVEINSLIL